MSPEPVAPPELLHRLFERQAAVAPEAPALVYLGRQTTYAELDRRANQLARYLRTVGIRRGDCVALLLPRSDQVYLAMLGILKAGAAYVPLDPDYPAERVSFILADSRARLLITSAALAAKAPAFLGQTVLLRESEAQIASHPLQPLDPAETGAAPEDLCYIIYTSGTTGRPKGVQIEHHSVCHLVRAEGALFQVRRTDRVFQGFSIAFDASVEEIWLAFYGGATLVVPSVEMVRSGPALSGLLTGAGVTVLSCVPTLLAMMEDDVPSLRLLILGGEVCRADLVQRWWKPGRRVVNTYGPTEATVIATYCECHPDKPVTIGWPLPGYEAVILEEGFQPVSSGEAGELLLGGAGLARGYAGNPELTAQKFIFRSSGDGVVQRFYRTGDRARWTENGELEFLGRLDTQVKIRGFRVELSEIESVLTECPEIKAAAVVLREQDSGIPQLIAYVVPRGTHPIDGDTVRAWLKERLPNYMVPAVIEVLSALPTLASGKVDRNALPVPSGHADRAQPINPCPCTRVEQTILETWAKLFAPVTVSLSDDFFLDLGGHSLLAARMVSELRRVPGLHGLSMADVYRFPTIKSLAREFERPPTAVPSAAATKTPAGLGATEPKSAPTSGSVAGSEFGSVEDFHPTSFWRHFFCGLAQLVSLVFILSFFALQWLAPYLTYTVLVEEEFDFLTSILAAFASLVLLYPIMLAVPILLKWLMIGRYRPGRYPLWGWYYFRFWVVTAVEGAVPISYLSGTPLLSIYLRLMGAKIGRNVFLYSDEFAIYDLLTIGDDSSINADATLLGYRVDNGFLKIGAINLGERCFVGARSAVGLDTTMGNDSALEDLSLLPDGKRIPPKETWAGSPAQPCGNLHPAGAALGEAPGVRRVSLQRRFVFGLLHGIGLLIFPILVVAALFPGIALMNQLNYLDPYYWYLLLSPLVGVSFVVLLCLEIAAVKWVLLGRIRPGGYRLDSWYYLRKWFVDKTMELSLDVVGPLYASVYLSPWYWLLGAKLGRGAEISTASFISPDLLSIGEASFIADNVSLGAPRVRNGGFSIGPIHIGRRSFIGNSALLPPGTVIGDSVLIGCLSVPPADPAEMLRADTAWLGSPAMFLRQRQHSTAFSEETTFDPPTKLRVQRAVIEFVRIITPSTGFIILTSLLFSALLLLHDYFSLAQTLLFFPLLYIGCGLAAALFVIVSKWLLVGRYRACERPLWSTFVWRSELLNALHEHLAGPFLIANLTGTPFLCWYFRLLGARVGRRVYLDTTDFTEFDLARIGDEAALNSDCTVQTHLFEDRVMKVSEVNIGARCSVGAGSLVLYDTCMDAGSSLGTLSLLMKGEVLPAGTAWAGIPARPASRRT